MTIARKQFGFMGEKVANHSVRKTGIGRLLDSNLPDIYVAQQVGMKNSDSLISYKAPNKEHRLQISDVLSGKRETIAESHTVTHAPVANVESGVDFLTNAVTNASDVTRSVSPQASHIITFSQENKTSHTRESMFAGASFKDCTFNFGVQFGGKKRKRVILSSSDEED